MTGLFSTRVCILITTLMAGSLATTGVLAQEAAPGAAEVPAVAQDATAQRKMAETLIYGGRITSYNVCYTKLLRFW